MAPFFLFFWDIILPESLAVAWRSVPSAQPLREVVLLKYFKFGNKFWFKLAYLRLLGRMKSGDVQPARRMDTAWM